MLQKVLLSTLLCTALFSGASSATAGQAPGREEDADVPVSHRDRVYAAEQFSNTVSVTDPADNKLWESSGWATRRPATSARSTADRCWCMAWVTRLTTAHSRWCPSAPTP